MTTENQSLLDAIRVVVGEAVMPLAERMDGLTERMDGLTERMDGLDVRVTQLGHQVEAIDTRTSQMAGDLHDLRDRVPLLEERVDNGFRALKSDLNFAFSDARKVSAAQTNSEKAIEALKRELASVQQRLAALERSKGA
jgi:chromosome segregation ATPase